MMMERTNSVAGIICNRLRSGMKTSTLSRLVLGRAWMKDFVSTLDVPKGAEEVLEWGDEFAPAAEEE